MNAYELAEEWGKYYDRPVLAQKTGFAMQIMLRQQADEIKLLRQGIKDGFDGLETMTAFSKTQADRIAELEKTDGFFGRGERVIRQMPEPKQLTDEEIVKISKTCDLNHVLGIIDFARAIQRKITE